MATPENEFPDFSLDLVEKLFGRAQAAYIKKKNTGGRSTEKGISFEYLFAAHSVARLAQQCLVSGEDPVLKGQVCGYVDDLVINRNLHLRQNAYQLKNSPTVSWVYGRHPIKEDFAYHFKLAHSMGYKDVRLRLVTSDAERRQALEANMPDELKLYTKVIHFPFDEHINKLVTIEERLRDDFGYLSRNENYTADDAAIVATMLIAAWIRCQGTDRNTLLQIIETARECSPMLLRSLRSDEDARNQLSEQAKEILDNLEGFSYTITRGFFSWDAFGCSGFLSYDCFDPRFDKFQKLLIEKSPQTFDDIEGWLI